MGKAKKEKKRSVKKEDHMCLIKTKKKKICDSKVDEHIEREGGLSNFSIEKSADKNVECGSYNQEFPFCLRKR